MPSLSLFLLLSFASHAAVRQPLIAIACHLEPGVVASRANGYDCTVAHAEKLGWSDVSSDADDDERLLRGSAAFKRLAYRAEYACGPSCRFFYGGYGRQCLAVAQSPYFTGLGSFTGRERTQADAERTALHDCEEFVGQPGEACRIIISQCSF